jgi:hypothetical protein
MVRRTMRRGTKWKSLWTRSVLDGDDDDGGRKDESPNSKAILDLLVSLEEKGATAVAFASLPEVEVAVTVEDEDAIAAAVVVAASISVWTRQRYDHTTMASPQSHSHHHRNPPDDDGHDVVVVVVEDRSRIRSLETCCRPNPYSCLLCDVPAHNEGRVLG